MTTAHEYETGDIRGLESALKQLHGYCSDFQVHAMAASGAAAGQWVGMASTEFQNAVHVWQTGATLMTAHAEYLATWAGYAATQYETAQSSVTGNWAG